MTEKTNTENIDADKVETEEASAVEVTDKVTESAESVEQLKAKLEEWKKFSRTHEDEKKALLAEKDSWTKTRESYEAKLSKISTELEEKSSRLQQITVESLRNKTAAEYKLPTEAMPLLRGNTEEELKAEAELLSKISGFSAAARTPLVIKDQGSTRTQKGTGDPIEDLKLWQAKHLKK